MTEQDRLSWIAHTLTHAVRPMIAGHVPAWVYSANYPGSGKTTLAQAAAWISLGVMTPALALKLGTPKCTDTLFSYAHKPAILLDNVDERIASASLEGAITSGSMTDRRYYTQTDATKAWRPVVAITSNFGEVGPDMARRVMPVRLEKKTIRHQYVGSLLEHANRSELAAAALTIVRAYVMNGEDVRVTAWTSFDEWAALVAAPLAWLGQGDLVSWRSEGIVEMADDDDTASEVHAAIREWMGVRSFAAREVCEMADDPALRRLQSLLKDQIGGRDVQLTDKRVGKILAKLELSKVGMLRHNKTNKGKFWQLVEQGQ
jgi:hypothetical protein